MTRLRYVGGEPAKDETFRRHRRRHRAHWTRGLQHRMLAQTQAYILLWVGFHCGRWARRCRPTGSAVLSMPGPTSHVEFMIEKVACAGQKLRPVGSALSPNGLGFADDDKSDMVSLALMDKVVEVDRVSGRARVQVPHTVALLLASCAAVFLGRKQGSPRPVLCLTK